LIQVLLADLPQEIVVDVEWFFFPQMVVNSSGRPHYTITPASSGSQLSAGYGDGVEEVSGSDWIVTYDPVEFYDPGQGGMLWSGDSPLPVTITVPAGVSPGIYAVNMPGHYNDGGPVHESAIRAYFEVVCMTITITGLL
jgi:hypothetical protein